MNHKFSTYIRRASLEYRDKYGKNPKILFLSPELFTVLCGGRWKTEGPGSTGYHWDGNHCTLELYQVPADAGSNFNFIGDIKSYEEAYKTAVVEYALLTDRTDSKSPIEERYEKSGSGTTNNVTDIFGKRNGSVR